MNQENKLLLISENDLKDYLDYTFSSTYNDFNDAKFILINLMLFLKRNDLAVIVSNHYPPVSNNVPNIS